MLSLILRAFPFLNRSVSPKSSKEAEELDLGKSWELSEWICDESRTLEQLEFFLQHGFPPASPTNYFDNRKGLTKKVVEPSVTVVKDFSKFPQNPKPLDQYFDSSTGSLYQWKRGAWVVLANSPKPSVTFAQSSRTLSSTEGKLDFALSKVEIPELESPEDRRKWCCTFLSTFLDASVEIKELEEEWAIRIGSKTFYSEKGGFAQFGEGDIRKICYLVVGLASNH